jgi:hypothetical protein
MPKATASSAETTVMAGLQAIGAAIGLDELRAQIDGLRQEFQEWVSDQRNDADFQLKEFRRLIEAFDELRRLLSSCRR